MPVFVCVCSPSATIMKGERAPGSLTRCVAQMKKPMQQNASSASRTGLLLSCLQIWTCEQLCVVEQ